MQKARRRAGLAVIGAATGAAEAGRKGLLLEQEPVGARRQLLVIRRLFMVDTQETRPARREDSRDIACAKDRIRGIRGDDGTCTSWRVVRHFASGECGVAPAEGRSQFRSAVGRERVNSVPRFHIPGHGRPSSNRSRARCERTTAGRIDCATVQVASLSRAAAGRSFGGRGARDDARSEHSTREVTRIFTLRASASS